MLRYLVKFLYIVGEQKKRLIQVILLFLTTSLFDTIGIGLIGPFMALASNPQAIHQRIWLNSLYVQLNLTSEVQFVALFGLILTLIFYAKSFLTFRVQKAVFKFSYDQKGKLAERLLSAYLAAPYTFHLGINTSLLIQNVLTETTNFCNGIMLPLLNSTSYVIITVCLTGLLIKTNLYATGFILAILIIPFLLYQSFKHRLGQWGKQASRAQVGMIRTINHSLGGLKETRMIGCESYFKQEMHEHVQNFEDALSSSQTFTLLPRIVIEAILITFLVGFTSIFLLSGSNTQNLTSTLGIFAIASIRLIPSISQLTNASASMRKYSYVLTKLYCDLKEIDQLDMIPSEYLEQSELGTEMSFSHEITLENVTYTYPTVKKPALDNISLTLKKGESIGLIGKSGAGKTTLVDVILGLLSPEQGDIQADHVSIYPNLRSWQNLIGYIPQSIFLMDDTVERNIAFGVPKHLINPHKMENAIQMAQLTELIQSLPDGLQTMVGERGVRLSGGQRQRVGIARTLYHERDILILDEATAALDSETEGLVTDAIKSLSGIKTIIIIAHRLTTVEHCDRIYQLDKGRIVKSGTYKEVVLGAILSH